MKKKIVAGALTALALTVGPAVAAEAKGPKSGKGKAERQALKQAKRCSKGKRVGFEIRGTLASFDGSTATLNVVRANRHARRWLDSNDPAFGTEGVRLSFEGVTDGADEDTTVGLGDVVATDRVKVQGKLLLPRRGCDVPEQNLSLKRIKVNRPDAEDEDENVTTEEPSTTPSA